MTPVLHYRVDRVSEKFPQAQATRRDGGKEENGGRGKGGEEGRWKVHKQEVKQEDKGD